MAVAETVKPKEETTIEERIIAAALKRNPTRVTLPTDGHGRVMIDEEAHPDIYDWAVNG